METVIAIGVLAVLLTGFIAVFAPPPRASASRSTSRRPTASPPPWKANWSPCGWGQSGGNSAQPASTRRSIGSPNRIRGRRRRPLRLSVSRQSLLLRRADGTARPFTASGTPGKDYIVQPMARRKSDPLFEEDFKALEGNMSRGEMHPTGLQRRPIGKQQNRRRDRRSQNPETGREIRMPTRKP
jgi:hypothetical protein